MNKNAIFGIGMDNLASIILVVIVIVLILSGSTILVMKLYTMGATTDQQKENAKTIINTIEAKINAIPENENTKILIPKIEGDWFLFGWSQTDLDRPAKCYFSSCVCICNGNWNDESDSGEKIFRTDIKEKCQESSSACRTVDLEKITIELPRTIGTFVIDLSRGTESADLVEIEIHRNKTEITIQTN